MRPAADAIARVKLRVEWPALEETPTPGLPALPARAQMLDGLWAALRQQHAAPGPSQDERVVVRAVIPGDAGSVRVTLRYVFDADHASQYDKTETFDAELVLDAHGALVAIVHWTPHAT